MPPKGFVERFKEGAKGLHGVVKERKVLSGFAKKMGWTNAAKILNMYGYGRGGQVGGAVHAMMPQVITGVPVSQPIYPGYFGDPGTMRKKKGQSGGSVWSWIKGAANTVYKGAIKPVARVLRPVADVVGTVAGYIPHPIAQGISTGAKIASTGAKMVGGRRSVGITISGLSFD